MSRATITATTLTLATLTLAVAPACGTDGQQLRENRAVSSVRPSVAQVADRAIARRLDGLYTASIRGPALRGLPGLQIPSGTWGLRIDVAARTLRLIPPEGGDITLRLVGVDASRLRLAPDTACESRAGRTATSHFIWARTNALLRLERVNAPCRSDATVLTSAPWQAAWPAPHSASSSVASSRSSASMRAASPGACDRAGHIRKRCVTSAVTRP